MTHSEAVDMIREGLMQKEVAQTWVDLGCGSGRFTMALASLLAKGSRVFGVDKNKMALGQLTSLNNEVEVIPIKADFKRWIIPRDTTGVLMANSIHYLKQKQKFLLRLQSQIGRPFNLILIEYDTEQWNPWVPHPLSFAKLCALMGNLNQSEPTKLSQRVSRIRGGMMYSARMQITP